MNKPQYAQIPASGNSRRLTVQGVTPILVSEAVTRIDVWGGDSGWTSIGNPFGENLYVFYDFGTPASFIRIVGNEDTEITIGSEAASTLPELDGSSPPD